MRIIKRIHVPCCLPSRCQLTQQTSALLLRLLLLKAPQPWYLWCRRSSQKQVGAAVTAGEAGSLRLLRCSTATLLLYTSAALQYRTVQRQETKFQFGLLDGSNFSRNPLSMIPQRVAVSDKRFTRQSSHAQHRMGEVNWIWDIAGAVGNLISCYHPCGTVNPRRAPTPGFGCHTGCPVITQACTCTTYRALPASLQSSIVPVHKGGAPLPRARGPGCKRHICSIPLSQPSLKVSVT
jgi:hypothetical protein